MRITLALIIAAFVFPAAAEAKPLSKRQARSEALRFITPFVDLLDVERTVTPIMEAPRDCRRVRVGAVRCQFKAYLHTGREVQSWVTVRRQRDGLFGFNLHLDVFAESA